jgi:hypothetical protein
MGAEHAGDEEGHAEREGEGCVSFEEDDYKRLPWVLQVHADPLFFLVVCWF